jgi:hypothetical protein
VGQNPETSLGENTKNGFQNVNEDELYKIDITKPIPDFYNEDEWNVICKGTTLVRWI